jgi:hypothetical protein
MRVLHWIVSAGLGFLVAYLAGMIVLFFTFELFGPHHLIRSWLLIILIPFSAGLLTIWVSRPRRKPEFGGSICRHCGYDLRATPDRCPECGTIPVKNATISS